MHFAYLTLPEITNQNTVGNVNHDPETYLFLCQESSHGQLPCFRLGFGLGLCSCNISGLNFWRDKLVGDAKFCFCRINIIEIVEQCKHIQAGSSCIIMLPCLNHLNDRGMVDKKDLKQGVGQNDIMRQNNITRVILQVQVQTRIGAERGGGGLVWTWGGGGVDPPP